MDAFLNFTKSQSMCYLTVILPDFQNNVPASAMIRRNTYVCTTDRNSTDRPSLLQNGKENR